MPSIPDNTAPASEKKSTEITDLPAKEGNVEGDEAVTGGGLLVPCVRTKPKSDREIVPCVRPGGSF